ncbi:hypothetical protein [Oceanobacillus saliphilus]|uniref:hypothetical protein n=1 Tax=Oceanobacillus saliphilus TaxID=2925834 RepID=UPI00201E52C7|nr:hypothetical protein [Oceanobacillus saliphilus]
MNMLNLSILAAAESPFANFAQEYTVIFYLAIMTFALSIVLRSTKFFLTQLALVLVVLILNETAIIVLQFLFTAIQVLLTATILYKMKKAIDYNYALILEKTHETPRRITTSGYNGTRSTF